MRNLFASHSQWKRRMKNEMVYERWHVLFGYYERKKLNIKFKPCYSLHWNCFQKIEAWPHHKLWLHHNARDNDAFTNGLQWYRKTYYFRHHVTRRKSTGESSNIYFSSKSTTVLQNSNIQLSHQAYCIGYIFCSYADRLWWKKCVTQRKHSPWNSVPLLPIHMSM